MTHHPLRIQRSRRKGSRLPVEAIVVTRPGRWGNPFHSAGSFHSWLVHGTVNRDDLRDPHDESSLETRREAILRDIATLRGKQLACWCRLDHPCHADVLATLANP